jgi:hypothetical protein
VDCFISYIVDEKQSGLSAKDLTKVFHKAGEERHDQTQIANRLLL